MSHSENRTTNVKKSFRITSPAGHRLYLSIKFSRLSIVFHDEILRLHISSIYHLLHYQLGYFAPGNRSQLRQMHVEI